VLPEDSVHGAEMTRLFPPNRFDVTGQQLDLRQVNSWNLLLDQVDPSELVEVFAINGRDEAGQQLCALRQGESSFVSVLVG
jgi:hypothetical protein